MKAGFFIAATIAAAALLDCNAAPIHRCFTSNLGVSYQEEPCAAGNDAGEFDFANFPDINAAERDRLLQREAALDRRLEAQRDRLSQEEMTRISARAQVAAAQAVAVAPVEPPYYGGWQIARNRAPHGRMRVPYALVR
jgi:hypothetical protein